MPSIVDKAQNLAAMSAALTAIVDAGPQAKVGLRDTMAIAQIKPTAGEWYHCAKCEECRSISPVCSDPSGGKRGNQFSGEGALDFKCHQCGNDIHALADDIFPFQWIGLEN